MQGCGPAPANRNFHEGWAVERPGKFLIQINISSEIMAAFQDTLLNAIVWFFNLVLACHLHRSTDLKDEF